MKRVLSTLMAFLMLVLGMSLSACTSNGSGQNADTGKSSKNIKSVTAITEVFSAGQRLTAIVVEYDKDIDNSKLDKSDFSVDGRTITKVYANTEAAKASEGTNGKYVILELSTDETNALIFDESVGAGTPSDNQTVGNRKEVKVSVTQTGDIVTTDGKKYVANTDAITNDKVINPVVDDFKKLQYKDTKTGKTLKYNLFVPKNYDKNKSYPMVTFIEDMSVISSETDTALVQGLGGIIWATPSEQAKHECFVLAPQYETKIANDDWETTDEVDTTVNLINSLASDYSIDKNRLYATGQSMGCLTTIALNIKYPDLFAATIPVAGKWDPTTVASLANKNMWFIVSKGDLGGYPSMNAIMETLEKSGAKISRATWNGQSSAAEFEKDVSKMVAEGNNIKYTVFEDGTVIPKGYDQNNHMLNHFGTWWIAYNIEGVRDWLFTQVKNR